VTLITHLHPVPRLRMSGSINLLLHISMAWIDKPYLILVMMTMMMMIIIIIIIIIINVLEFVEFVK
jgi:hypothetical protein